VTVSGTQSAASIEVSRGAVSLAGGALNTGSFNVAAGASCTVLSTVTGGAAGGLIKSGTGTLMLSSANAYAGPTSVTAGTLVLGSADAIGPGILDVSDAAVTQLMAGLPKAALLTGLSLHSTGRLDLTNGSAVFRNISISQVRSLITQGFDGGAWDGPGIFSSNAAADANGLTAVGYVSNADYGATDFKGVAGLTANDVLVKFTYYGDADLSGAVTLDDFSQFLNGYRAHNPATNNWLNGDFDYSGAVSLDDFSQFLYGYQHQGGRLSDLEDAIAATNLSLADRAVLLAAVQAVPEPGASACAITALATTTSVGARRRRRRTA
jgi:autotransporter-associated beta strand protein